MLRSCPLYCLCHTQIPFPLILLCDWIQPHSSHQLVLRYQEKNLLSSSYLHGSDFSTTQAKLIYIHPLEQQPDSLVRQDLLMQNSCKTSIGSRVFAAERSLNSHHDGASSSSAFPTGGRLGSSYTQVAFWLITA